jgi:4-hydroxy-tetrahydrodipicolinate reductase
VVIHGTGHFGCLLAQAVIRKGWPIVAAFDVSPDKVGQDLGRLCKLDRDLGVVVQHAETADISALKADVALVAAADAPADNLAAYTRLMAAGINVLCQGGGSNYVWDYDPQTAAVIDALARQHGVTWTGGGAWDLCRVWSGILVAGANTQVDQLHHQTLTNLSLAPPFAKHLVQAYGVGLSRDEFHARMVVARSRYVGIYRTVLPQVVKALGFTVTEVTERIEGVFLSDAVPCKALERDMAPGECVGMRVTMSAATREGLVCTGESEFKLAGDAKDAFTWTVEGDVSNRITVERLANAPGTTVGLMVNRIPDVIAAAPGIQDVSQLGPPRTRAAG